MKCFKSKYSYNLSNPRTLASKHKSTRKYSIDTIAFKGPKIWRGIRLDIRNLESLRFFKSNIEQMWSASYRCKICRSFIANLGHIK